MRNGEGSKVVITIITSFAVLSCHRAVIHEVLIMYERNEIYNVIMTGTIQNPVSIQNLDMNVRLSLEGEIEKILWPGRAHINHPSYDPTVNSPPLLQASTLSSKDSWKVYQMLTQLGIPYKQYSNQGSFEDENGHYYLLSLEERLALYNRSGP